MMTYRPRLRILLAMLGVLLTTSTTQAKERQLVAVNADMQRAATSFLESLTPQQRAQSTFDFQGPQRTDWHFIPKQRVGVSIKEMTLPQRRAARVLMRSVLSEKGYLKAVTVMSLERVLRLMEADRENVNEIRDPEKYWFAVFGDPTGGKPWGWRVEGHHLTLNFTSIDGLIEGTTPIFLGSNPAEVRVGPRLGLRVLGDEEDHARRLMAALSPEQQAKAIISPQAPSDVLTVPGKPLNIGTPAGISATEMNDEQLELLQQMTESFLRHLRPALANKEIRHIEASGTDSLHFAWAGSLDPNESHYFRLHGKTFVFEYDNAQGNHAHLVWHSLENDFAADTLRKHYESSPHHHAHGE